MAFIFGIIVGYSWSEYHKELVCLKFNQTQLDLYNQKIHSFLPPVYSIHKTRNYNLIKKYYKEM